MRVRKREDRIIEAVGSCLLEHPADNVIALHRQTQLQVVQHRGGAFARGVGERPTSEFRGSSPRRVAVARRDLKIGGKRALDSLYLKLGQVEVDDIAEGVRALWGRPYFDRSRVGIFGTSYGGYVSLMALHRHPAVFAAASAAAAGSMTRAGAGRPRAAKPTRRVIPTDVDTVELRAGPRSVHLTNLRKPFWPELGIAKGDLLQYYVDVSPVLLPHLHDRAMASAGRGIWAAARQCDSPARSSGSA